MGCRGQILTAPDHLQAVAAVGAAGALQLIPGYSARTLRTSGRLIRRRMIFLQSELKDKGGKAGGLPPRLNARTEAEPGTPGRKTLPEPRRSASVRLKPYPAGGTAHSSK